MNGFDRIFIDTAPIIYLTENHPAYYRPVSLFFANQFNFFESSFITSSLTLAELFVKPKKNNNLELISEFKKVFTNLNFIIADVTSAIAESSAELRAIYPFLKSFDAIQVATARQFSCNKFFTNDASLKKLQELEVVLVNDLK